MKEQSWIKLRSALLGSAALALVAGPATFSTALAQDEAAAEDDAAVEEIVVTGSRIKRANIDTVEPAIVIGRDLIEKRAMSNIADLLNEIPAFGAPAASPIAGQNGFSVGQNIVDFLGLGSQRTLTLVNGRRYVSSNAPTVFGEDGGLQVDFNTIPIALVERIETIATGGAPTYGSDAIAGTINVILRDDFEGMETQFRYGTSDNGDADSYQLQTVVGGNFANDRGNIAIAVEYNRQQGLERFDRPFFTENDPFIGEVRDVRDVDGDGELDDVFQIFTDRRVQLLTFGGLISPGAVVLPSVGVGKFPGADTFFEFDTNGDLIPHRAGGIPPGSLFFATGGDGPDFFDAVAQIRSPLERLVVSGFSHYDVNEYVTAFTEFTFANSEAKETLNQGGFNTFAFGDTSGALKFSADHPLLTEQARAVLASLGVTGSDTFWMNRFNNDLVDGGRDQTENFLWRVVAGFQGDFQALGRNFYWDLSANFGQSDIETQGTDIIDARFINALDAIRITDADLQALVDLLPPDDPRDTIKTFQDASNVLFSRGGTESANVGDVICRSVLDVELGNIDPVSGSGIAAGNFPFIDGCIPLDIFGENRASAEAIDFVTGLQLSTSDIEQRVYTANFGGELIDLPGGTVGFNVGFQNRRETALFLPSGFDKLGLGRSSALAKTGGTFHTNEWYGELLIPIISPDMNIPAVTSLEINPKVRRVDNSRAGSADTYTLGGVIGFFNDLKLRGNFTRAIRSPSLVELFSPVVSTFAFGSDPCDDRFIDEGPDPATRRANCEAIGLGDGFTSNVVNATAQGKTGGNPNLQNETAKSYTVGGVWQPRWVPGMSLTVDYINIAISDRIDSLSLTQTMEACFDSKTFPDPICNNFTRDATGQVIDFSTGQANAASSNLQAVTFDFRYAFEVADAFGLVMKSARSADYGSLTIRVNAIRRIQNASSIIGEEPTDNTGEFGQNKTSLTFDVSYDKGPLNVFYRILYTDSPILDADRDNFFENENGDLVTHSGDRFIHNMSIAHQVTDELSLRIAVNNLWNRKGSFFQRAVGDFTSGDERLGRMFLFTAKATF